MNKKVLIPIFVLLAVAIAVAAGYFRRGDKAIFASGTLEARNINVGSKVGGRVTKVAVAEGDHVQPNQLLVEFDSAELEAQLLQARGRYEQARANYEKMQRGSRPEEIAEARAAVELPGGAPGYAAQEVSEARGQLDRARADLTNAQVNFNRAEQLAKEGVVSREFRDDAEAKLKMSQAQVKSLEHTVSAAQGKLDAAKAVKQKVEKGNRSEDIAMAKANLLQAEGELKQMEARYAERVVTAPSSAVVEVLNLRPGDLVQANAPIAKLLESDQLYVMVYVPQDQIGHVTVGQDAKVTVDAFPNQPFDARVEQIRQQTEFLPRNVQTKEEREHQVVGVKLRVQNRDNKLRPGINAEVKFLSGSQSEAK